MLSIYSLLSLVYFTIIFFLICYLMLYKIFSIITKITLNNTPILMTFFFSKFCFSNSLFDLFYILLYFLFLHYSFFLFSFYFLHLLYLFQIINICIIICTIATYILALSSPTINNCSSFMINIILSA